jgi:hypothetical protein
MQCSAPRPRQGLQPPADPPEQMLAVPASRLLPKHHPILLAQGSQAYPAQLLGFHQDVETNDTEAAVAEQGATVAPQKAASKKAASRKKGAPQGQKTATGGQPRKPAKTGQKPARQARPRNPSKSAKILEMIGRTKGATWPRS